MRAMRPEAMFPYRVCINLDRRPERWQRVRRRFARHGLDPVIRFPAVDGAALAPPAGWEDPPGAYGCLLSHLEVVREARRRGEPSVLIFEDDVVFPGDFRRRFAAWAAEVPADWDMLYLGGLHELDPVPVTAHVGRLTSTYSTYAYAIRDTLYDAFEELNHGALAPVDYNNRELQKELACYGFLPSLAWVDGGYSDAQATEVSHWYLRESMVLKGSEIGRAQSRTLVVIPFRNRSRDPQVARILRFTIERFLETLPQAALVVVEQDGDSALDPGALPAGCGLLRLADTGPYDPDLCLGAAVAQLGAGKDLFFLVNCAMRISRPDIRASLLMGLRHDVVRPFRKVVDLDAADTGKVLAGREVDTAGYRSRRPLARGVACRVVTRRGLDALGGPPAFVAPATALHLQGGPPR